MIKFLVEFFHEVIYWNLITASKKLKTKKQQKQKNYSNIEEYYKSWFLLEAKAIIGGIWKNK